MTENSALCADCFAEAYGEEPDMGSDWHTFGPGTCGNDGRSGIVFRVIVEGGSPMATEADRDAAVARAEAAVKGMDLFAGAGGSSIGIKCPVCNGTRILTYHRRFPAGGGGANTAGPCFQCTDTTKDQHVTIPNPDDELDSLPIFDGPASEARMSLKPGTYVTDSGDKFIVGREQHGGDN